MYKICIEKCGYIDYIDNNKIEEIDYNLICPDCGSYLLQHTDSYFLNKKAGLIKNDGPDGPFDQVEEYGL